MDLNELIVYKFNNKIRLGNNFDGGYVIGELNGQYDAYFSCGIAEEESFTRDFLKTYLIDNKDTFAFDGTINNYPSNYSSTINFINKNINGHNIENNTNLINESFPYNNIFMKMDIEGGEYSWISQISENVLYKFKQIVIEFHGINDNSWNIDLNTKIICLNKLNKTHYIIHAHGNNHSTIKNNIPDVLELTFVRKDYFPYKPDLNSTKLPITNIDFPNKCFPDYNLNFYPFVN